MKIDPRAVVHQNARIARDVEIGPFSIVGENVTIGAGTRIDSSVVIDGWTAIGKNCRIFPGVVIGTEPQDVKYKGARSYVEIGDNNIIREFTTVHRGTDEESKTVIGSDNFIMAYCHFGHNSKVGNNVIMANGVTLGGFVEVEDRAYISGFVPIHQFIRIGTLSLSAPLTRLTMDLPPYLLADGNPPQVHGLNTIGLERAGFTAETISLLKKAYKLLSRSKLNISQAVAKIEKELEPIPEIKHFVEFIKSTKRGIHR